MTTKGNHNKAREIVGLRRHGEFMERSRRGIVIWSGGVYDQRFGYKGIWRRFFQQG